jgi:hypothetical protein
VCPVDLQSWWRRTGLVDRSNPKVIERESSPWYDQGLSSDPNSVLAASFRGALSASALQTIPNKLRSAAKDSLGSALGIAGSSSDPKRFAEAARVAYVSAMHTGLLVAALATFAGALASGLVLGRRHVPLSVLAGGPLTD